MIHVTVIAIGASLLTPVTSAQAVQWTKLTPPDANRQHSFGGSVAIDGGTVAIGAYGDDDRGLDAGAVYIYERSKGGWKLTAKLTGHDTAYGDSFGSSVGLSGNVLVVGASLSSRFAYHQGLAYVFERKDNVWEETARLRPQTEFNDPRFGGSVATDGQTVVIGSRYEVSVFEKTGGEWGFITQIPSTGLYDHPGADDIEMDLGRIAYGNGSGVMIYERIEGGWLPTANIRNPVRWPYAFGSSVALQGSTLIVSNPRTNDVLDMSGTVYVYDYDGIEWSLREALKSPKVRYYQLFGASVALSRQLLAVGIHSFIDFPWLLYLFDLTGSNARLVAVLRAPLGGGIFFGFPVTASANTMAVSDLSDSSKVYANGAVYIYEDLQQFRRP